MRSHERSLLPLQLVTRIQCSWPLRLLLAVLLTVLAVLLRLVMAPMDAGVQYITLFPAVALVAVIGGLWAGLAAAGLGVALASYLFWPPHGSFVFAFQSQMLLSNGVFLLDALLVCSAIEAMHRFYRRSETAAQALQSAASIFEHTAEGVMMTDLEGYIQSVNPAFTAITGYTADEAIGRKPSLLRSDRQGPEFYRALWQTLNSEGIWQGELWNRRKDGEAYLEWLTINRVVDGHGKVVSYVGVFHDVTEARRQDERNRHLAYHDALTGLPNRVLMQDRLEHALQRARREGGKLSVAFIDLDRFKQVNDTLGHAVGDDLLIEVASRITARLRSMDTVARLGGDEFLLLMEDQRGIEASAKLLEVLIDEISRPMLLQGHSVRIGASVGVACFPDDGEDVGQLLRNADQAMYAAKTAGRNQFCFYAGDDGKPEKGKAPYGERYTGLSRRPD